MRTSGDKRWTSLLVLALSASVCPLALMLVFFNVRGSFLHLFSGQEHSVLTSSQPSVSRNLCMRRCQNYNNKILYSSKEAAGLNDRKTVLKRISSLAGYLCATVQYRRPAETLNVRHNDGRLLDPGMRWSDFYDFHFSDESRTASVSDGDQFWETYNRSKGGDRRYFHTQNATTIVKDFKAVETSTLLDRVESRSFLWEISANFFAWNEELADSLEGRKPGMDPRMKEAQPQILSWSESLSKSYTGCHYTSADEPVLVKFLVDDVWNNITARTGEGNHLGYLHVRRGDAKRECDSSLDTMAKYLTCSFRDTKRFGRIGLVFSSDEKNVTYRNEVMRLANEQGSVETVDLDSLVSSRINHYIASGKVPSWMLNNYHIYHLVVRTTRREEFDFHVQRRRGFACENCNSVSDQIKA